MPDFIEEKYRQWRQISGEYEKAFSLNSDPEIVIEFLKKYNFALKEEWVVGEVNKWMLNDKKDLLKRAFLPLRGERSDKNRKKIENLMIVNNINKLIKDGYSKTGAFERLSQVCRPFRGAESIRNIYYRTMRRSPEIYVSDNGAKINISVFPAKIEFEVKEHIHRIYGIWSIELNK